jgi:hypothetical protein
MMTHDPNVNKNLATAHSHRRFHNAIPIDSFTPPTTPPQTTIPTATIHGKVRPSYLLSQVLVANVFYWVAGFMIIAILTLIPALV